MMKHLLSIFSFKTLKLSPRVPRTLLVALLVIACVEAGVRYRRAQKELNFGHSFVHLIHDYEEEAATGSADVWLLGNSTLAAGIDEADFESITGLQSLKMPHGMCNVGGYAAMLDYYLDRAPAPDRLIIFISKDDLNSGGLRAESTRAYHQYASESNLRPSHWLMLNYDREELRESAVDQIDVVYSTVRGQEPAKASRFDIDSVESAVFAPQGPLEDVYNLYEAVNKWTYDRASLHALIDTARAYGVQEIGVVLLPCTDALAQMHDRLVPEMSYAELRATTRALFEDRGVSCLDIAVASDRYDLFYDAYHSNATGRRVITRLVGDWVAGGMGDEPAMTAAQYDAAAQRVLAEKANEERERLVTRSGAFIQK